MQFKLFKNEVQDLVDLLINNEWRYHSGGIPQRDKVKVDIESGYYSDGRETFWLIDVDKKVGIIVIDDIDDTIPQFDIRLDAKYQGKGYGVKSLKWLQDYLFGKRGKIRIEGYTRADNLPMRKCFTKAGFVKEGYLRNSWENECGTVSDTVLYGAIFEDWQAGKITNIKLSEIPY
ncbi:GNAT family N-acetyltransferase [Sporosarcina aquimarina]|uniref:GNAT family N-acetyltransferase n=1 Tax=Sporosarcina aquimarina TaxID=114975 RepID=UPI00203EABA1|nr:GNAT family protein [Sporosarcina aquimarina]MCM3759027.1 GNAT family N-acetyltransferase [Sporosarcina aquimarina]